MGSVATLCRKKGTSSKVNHFTALHLFGSQDCAKLLQITASKIKIALCCDHCSHLRVLCPGSGLGRLPFEVVRRGYGCQGNEFSFFMLLGTFTKRTTNKVCY